MPLPPDLRSDLEKTLWAYRHRRVPRRVRDRLRLGHTVRGNSVTLYEERPLLRRPEAWGRSSVAQFRFDGELWRLYCRDRNGRWHRFAPAPPSRDIADLLAAVDDDATGIFWG